MTEPEEDEEDRASREIHAVILRHGERRVASDLSTHAMLEEIWETRVAA